MEIFHQIAVAIWGSYFKYRGDTFPMLFGVYAGIIFLGGLPSPSFFGDLPSGVVPCHERYLGGWQTPSCPLTKMARFYGAITWGDSYCSPSRH